MSAACHDRRGTRVALHALMLIMMFVVAAMAAAVWALHQHRDNAGIIELDDSDIIVGPPLPTYATAKGASSSAVRSRNI